MAGTHDTIVLVHGADASATQGAFLNDVAEPLVRWLEANGGELLTLAPSSIRRGPRPARLDLSGRLPDPDRPGESRPFEWRIIEARWNDEYTVTSERAVTWRALRNVADALIDHLGWYDPAWRAWRAIAGLGVPLGALALAPEAATEAQAWRYRFDTRWPLPLRLLLALWLGVLAPVLLLGVLTPVVLLALPLWLVTGATAEWQHAVWNGWLRLLLALVWLPTLALAAALLAAILALALLPFAVPCVGALRRGVLGVLRLRWLDTHAFTTDRVSGAAIEEAVGSAIAAELESARTLTIVGFELGAAIAYETLGALARPTFQPEVQNPYVTVSQALSAIDRPLPRYGLPVTLITVGGVLNRALGWRRRTLLRDPLPEGTRWVDAWSTHDPVAMGSVDRRLVAASGVPLVEARLANAPGILGADDYRANLDLAALIADEVIAASATQVLAPADGERPEQWQPRAEGTWAWRSRNGLADRDCTRARRAVARRISTGLRATAYAGVAAYAWLTSGAVEAESIDLLALSMSALLGAAAVTLGFAVLDPLAAAAGEAWANRPCRHTVLIPSAVRV
ncbi:MAG: hypothetical protein WC211_05365 [Dehalococcoidia bacterium]